MAALVVAAGAEEEAADEPDPAPALALLAASTIPPCTVVGDTALAFAAAALYAAMVLEPDLHRHHISKDPSFSRWARYSRRINNHRHPRIAMPHLATIQPHRIRIIHRDHKRIGRAGKKARPYPVRARHARRAERGLRDRVVAGLEVEDDGVADRGGERVRLVGEGAAGADGDGVDCGGA